MQISKPETQVMISHYALAPRVIAFGAILTSLLYPAIASDISRKHSSVVFLTPLNLPLPITATRIILAIVSISLVILIPIFDRQIRAKNPNKTESDLALAALVISSTFLIVPVILAACLFMFGLPRVDVYVYASISFFLLAINTWFKRNLLLYRTEWCIPQGSDQKLHCPPMDMYLTKAYTITIAILGLIGVLRIALKTIVILYYSDEYKSYLDYEIPWIIAYSLVIAFCFYVVMQRLRKTKNALPLTALVSTTLAFWIPFGTIAYIYWKVKISKREGFVSNQYEGV